MPLRRDQLLQPPSTKQARAAKHHALHELPTNITCSVLLCSASEPACGGRCQQLGYGASVFLPIIDVGCHATWWEEQAHPRLEGHQEVRRTTHNLIRMVWNSRTLCCQGWWRAKSAVPVFVLRREAPRGMSARRTEMWQPGVGAPCTHNTNCCTLFLVDFISLSLIVMHRESEEKLNRQAEEKALEKRRQAGELVEAVEDKLDEIVDDRMDRLETASADVLDLDEGTPQSLGIVVAKVAVVSAAAIKPERPVLMIPFHESNFCACLEHHAVGVPPGLYFITLSSAVA